MCSLTSVVDDLLQEIAPRGIEGERVRRHVLRAEREIRKLVAEGARGMLTDLWDASSAEPRGRPRSLEGRRRGRRLRSRAAAAPRRARLAQRPPSESRPLPRAGEPARPGAVGHPPRRLHPLGGRAPAREPAGCVRRPTPRPVRLRDDVAPARQEGAEGRAARRPARADRVGARGAEAATLLRALPGDRARANSRVTVRVPLQRAAQMPSTRSASDCPNWSSS